ncbi:MAG: hypothetical protein R3D57_18525 [Hyphomicrobiaceae bacterium]
MTSPVEVATVGGLSCLYRVDTGALALLNAEASQLWHDLQQRGEATTDDGVGPEPDAHDLKARWQAQGFLGGTAPAEPAGQLAVHAPSANGGADLDQRYTLGHGRAIRVVARDQVLAALLDAVLAPLACAAAVPDHLIEAFPCDVDRLAVQVDGATRLISGRAAARSEVLRQALLHLVGAEQVGAILHASTVAGPEGGILLLGASGSGKSTLATALLAQGLHYVADDLSALDRGGTSVHPFPIGLSVKSGSWSTVARRFPELDALPVLATRRLRVRYLDARSYAVAPAQTVRAQRLVFPYYAPGVALEAERLAPEAALQLAITTGSEPDGEPRSIHPLARLCDTVPAWHLAYGDVDQAADWIRSASGALA